MIFLQNLLDNTITIGVELNYSARRNYHHCVERYLNIFYKRSYCITTYVENTEMVWGTINEEDYTVWAINRQKKFDYMKAN